MAIFNDLKNTNQEANEKDWEELEKACKSLPKNGRLLGIDIGTKRIGIAISDASRFIATPKIIINRQSNLKDFAQIKKLLEKYEAVGIVAGMPVDMDESEIPMTKFALNFSENLDQFLEERLPIFFFDERLTSFEAREIGFSKLSRKKKRTDKHIDDIAASLILQGFMDVNCR